MLHVFRANKWFLVPYLIFLFVGGILLVSFPKTEIHWFINQQNNEMADTFFKYYTHLGDGIFIAVGIIILLFVSYRHTISLAIGSILATFIVQLIKRYILPDTDRPLMVFEKIRNLHLVDGITVHTAHSFPSGHSATAFSILLLFAFIMDNKNLKFLLFIIAFLVAYSRMYLSQHFLIDVYIGSLIGVISTILAFLWVMNWKNTRLDFSLINLFKSKNDDIKA